MIKNSTNVVTGFYFTTKYVFLKVVVLKIAHSKIDDVHKKNKSVKSKFIKKL